MLGLIAADLVLQGIDPLLALQIVNLLLLAHRIRLALDTIDLLVSLQALELLIVSVLIEVALNLSGLWL